MAAALGSPIAAYRCVNKKADGYAVYTNMVPAGGFRGYGASQTTFAIECAMDDLAKLLGSSPFEIRRINKVRETDRIESIWKDPSDVEFGSYGIDQCLDLVETALKSGRGLPKPEGDDWLEGTGVALAMLDSGPPTEHRSGAEMRLLPDGTYHLAVGSTEMGNGSTTSHRQIAASVLGTRASKHRHHQRRHRPDALRHRHLRQHRHGRRRPGGGEDRSRAPRCPDRLRQRGISAASRPIAACRTMRSSAPTGRFRSPNSMRPAPRWATASRCRRKAYLSPRSVGFNVHGVRVAVHRVTGEIMTLQSVHAADIGRLINPMQCRGQLDGAIAMGFGWALYEKMVYDDRMAPC